MHKITLFLTYRSVEHDLQESETLQPDSADHPKWLQDDEPAGAITGRLLLDDMLQNLEWAGQAKLIYEPINNGFQQHTILNRLQARRDIYMVERKHDEKMIPYAYYVQQFSLVFKFMNVDIDEKEFAIAILDRHTDLTKVSSRHWMR